MLSPRISFRHVQHVSTAPPGIAICRRSAKNDGSNTSEIAVGELQEMEMSEVCFCLVLFSLFSVCILAATLVLIQRTYHFHEDQH